MGANKKKSALNDPAIRLFIRKDGDKGQRNYTCKRMEGQGQVQSPYTTRSKGMNGDEDHFHNGLGIDALKKPRVRKVKVREMTEEEVELSSDYSIPDCASLDEMEDPVEEVPAKMIDVERYQELRKEIEEKKKDLKPLKSVLPEDFPTFLMNSKQYLLAKNKFQLRWIKPSYHSEIPSNLNPQIYLFLDEQEEKRHKLGMQQLVERQKLVLGMEQELLRVHSKAAMDNPNEAPLSFCSLLRFDNIFMLSDETKRDKSPYPSSSEGSKTPDDQVNYQIEPNDPFHPSLLEVYTKWLELKDKLISRQHTEATSLQVIQRFDLQCKMEELNDSPVQSHVNPKWYLNVPLVEVVESV